MDKTEDLNPSDGRSELWTTEDYWAIWLGFGLLLSALVLFAIIGRPADIEGERNAPGKNHNRYCHEYQALPLLVHCSAPHSSHLTCSPRIGIQPLRINHRAPGTQRNQ